MRETSKKIWMKLGRMFLVLFFCGFAATSHAQGFTKLRDVNTGGPTAPTSSSTSNSNSNSTTPIGGGGFSDNEIELNGVWEVKDLILMISKLTGRNFIFSDQLKGGKITIVSERKLSKEMAFKAFLSALEASGYTIVETPSGLISIVGQKESQSKGLDIVKDDTRDINNDAFVTRIVSLKNISANEIQQVIKGLEMVSKNGQIYAYPTTNSLIITDTGSNITHIMKMINELDQEGPQEIIDIVPIINADAKDVAEKVTQIFSDKESSSTAKATARPKRGGKSVDEMQDIPSVSKVIADARTNSVIIMGTKRDLAKVKALIAKLDRTVDGVEGSIHVYYLKHANAVDLAGVLSNLASGSSGGTGGASAKSSKTNSASSSSNTSSSSSSSNTKSTGGASSATASLPLENGAKVTADEATNSLIITASPKDYTTLVEKVIKKLDIVRPQVYLEAVIMALDVAKSSTLGFNMLGGLTSSVGGNDVTAFGSVLPNSLSSLSTIAGLSGGFGGGVLSADTIDFTLSDGSTLSVPAVSGLIQAVASDTDTNVLSTPSILTLDNEEATIQVGQEVPVPSGTTVSSGVTTFDVEREDTGIILKITPQISESDTVRLEIEQEITIVLNSDPALGPTLDKKSVSTTVVAKDKQTIVIGGLIDDQESVGTTKVPLLGDVPVLGALFRTRTKAKLKRNLVVFITPYIIRDREDYLIVLKKKIEERNAYIDLNYGRSQRRSIRESIQRHATELLEFSCAINDPGNPCYQENVNVSTSSLSGTTDVQTKNSVVDHSDKTKSPRVKRIRLR